jgi:hypothetical protein
LYGGESALDWRNRILYALLQPIGAETLPFYLVGIDVNSGKIVSEPVACADGCPNALEFANKPWHTIK